TPPPLIVETHELQFSDVNAPAMSALAGQMTDSEYATLVDDLTWGLPQLTGGTFHAFGSVTRQASPETTAVQLLNSNRITAARVAGLEAATGFIGFGRWRYQADGSLSGGVLMLDRDYERRGTPLRRAVRTHELGHALGCDHVTLTTSVMNAIVVTEPT